MAIKDSMHSDFSTGSGVWVGYRHDLTGDYVSRDGTGENYHEFADGTFREYNKKLNDIGIVGGDSIYFEPYDGGLRYQGNPFIHKYPAIDGRQGAYSTRTIGFGGPLMKVRRSSDNAELDVRGDAGGDISLASPLVPSSSGTLGGFVGTGAGYCSVWYDQFNTGSAQNNLTQTTAADQPIIVNGGSLITDSNGNAALDFNGSTHHMTLNTGFSSTLNISGLSSYLVFEADTVAGNQMVSCLGSFADSNKRWYFPYITSSNFSFNYGAGGAPTTGANTNLNLVSMVADSTQGAYKAFLNSSQVGSNGSLENKSGGTSLVGVGGLGDSLHFNGKMGEFIFYQSDSLSAHRTDIETNINSHFKIY